MQQIEQLGSMIQSCLNEELFDCNRKLSDGSLGPQLIDQKWNLKFKSSVLSKNIFDVQEVKGELISGQVFGKFKNEILQTDVISAEFSLKKNEDQSFELEVFQNFKITSSQANEILLLKSTARLAIEESVWTLVNFYSKLYSLKQNKTILSASDRIQLNWKSSACAEIAGLFHVQDGSTKAQITATGLSAVLTSASRTPWPQKLVGCTQRLHSHQNYDFLFY